MGLITRTNFGLVKKVQIPNAQVLTLPSTPVQLLPGPPAGQFWCPDVMICWLNPAIAPYGNIDGAVAWRLSICTFAIGSSFLPTTVLSGDTIVGGNVFFDHQPSPLPVTLICTNGALGNFTGGDVANVLNVELWYGQINV